MNNNAYMTFDEHGNLSIGGNITIGTIATNTTGPSPSIANVSIPQFKAVVNGSSVTVVPSSSGKFIPPPAPSPFKVGYNSIVFDDYFKSYIKTLEGKVLVCEEKIEKDKFIVPKHFAMKIVYQFLKQIPVNTPVTAFVIQPADDEIHRTYWRVAKKKEKANAMTFDEKEINQFLRDAQANDDEEQLAKTLAALHKHQQSTMPNNPFTNISVSGLVGSFITLPNAFDNGIPINSGYAYSGGITP